MSDDIASLSIIVPVPLSTVNAAFRGLFSTSCMFLLVPVEGGVQLGAFFEEPRTVMGRVAKIDFLKHTVTLVPPDDYGE